LKEIWKDVVGYEGLYRISNLGKIKSLRKNIILKPVKNSRAYCQVTLSQGNKRKNYRINRLVAIHFIENTLNKPHVNHIDEDKENNRADNLEWCTPKENCNHGTGAKRCVQNRNFDNRRKKVLQYSINGDFIKEWKSIYEISRVLNYNLSSISQCCHGKRKTSKRFVWKFKN
jgi:hypothetical protein